AWVRVWMILVAPTVDTAALPAPPPATMPAMMSAAELASMRRLRSAQPDPRLPVRLAWISLSTRLIAVPTPTAAEPPPATPPEPAWMLEVSLASTSRLPAVPPLRMTSARVWAAMLLLVLENATP